MNSILKKTVIAAAPFVVRKLLQGNKNYKVAGLFLLAIIFVVWVATQYIFTPPSQDSAGPLSESKENLPIGLSDVRTLFERQQSGIMVSVEGNVTRILSDDNDGSRHQRFTISAQEDLSLLIAHNIDLAPRVPIRVNDRVTIYGQYEWNNKGGLLHWTHHDPHKTHPGGWISHKNKKYE